MSNEKREQEMMAAADRYADEVCDESCNGAQVAETINDFCAGWRAADSNPAWVSVEERLPEENGKTQQSISVWATDGLTACEMRYNFDTKVWTDMFGDPYYITHWMPLPTPPAKKGGEQ